MIKQQITNTANTAHILLSALIKKFIRPDLERKITMHQPSNVLLQ